MTKGIAKKSNQFSGYLGRNFAPCLLSEESERR